MAMDNPGPELLAHNPALLAVALDAETNKLSQTTCKPMFAGILAGVTLVVLAAVFLFGVDSIWHAAKVNVLHGKPTGEPANQHEKTQWSFTYKPTPPQAAQGKPAIHHEKVQW